MPQQNEMLGVDTVQETVTPEELNNIESDLPESEVTVMAFQAVQDSIEQSVTGSEGYSYAQTYMSGVLLARGDIPSALNGCESLFSSVGSGISKLITFIKETFGKIWNFFFKKDVKTSTKDMEKAVDNYLDEIKDSTPEEMESKAGKITTSIKEIITTSVQKLTTGRTKDQGLLERSKKLEESSSGETKTLLNKAGIAARARIDARTQAINKLNALKAKAEKEANGTPTASVLHNILKEVKGEIVSITKKNTDKLSSLSSAISSRINAVEAAMKKGGKEFTSEDKDSLEALKNVMVQGNLVAQEITSINSTIKNKLKTTPEN